MLTHSRLGNHGRLGNQLFQIASILSVGDSFGQDVVFPDWQYAQFFDAMFPVGSVENARIYEESQFSHHVLPVAEGNWDLIGFFQSEKYFNFDIVKKQFRFTDEVIATSLARVKTPDKRRVLLSVRRGDFVNNSYYFQLNEHYYLQALSWLSGDFEVIVTSDDFDYCKSVFSGLGFTFADGLTAIEQLCLGASCDDFVISNSTFSWWQAWLGERPGSRVVRPLRNFGDACDEDESDYWPSRWTIYSSCSGISSDQNAGRSLKSNWLPKLWKNMTKPRILIGVVSCLSYEERRERCMQTWIPDALQAGFDVLFVVGGGVDRATCDGLTLTLPCADDYDSLPQKTCGLLQWALATPEYEFIFKCDDDTYLRPDRLISEATVGVDYLGTYWTENAGYASGGSGYLLSRHAAKIAARGLVEHPTGAEDLIVGQILRDAGIPLTKSDNLVPFADEQKRPKPTNQIISAHASDPPWKSHRVDFTGEPPIVSANPIGGLGNKMFEVAAAIGYAAKHPSHHPLMSLDHVSEFSGPIFQSLHFTHTPTEAMIIGDKPDFTHQEPEYWASRSVKFNGHMQSEKYFSHCRDRIRHAFTAKGPVLAKLLSRYRHLLGDSSVSLHVRRGDHITKSEYHPLQTTQYYREAIEYLDRHVNIRTIVCCSDDPQWCRDVLAKQDRRIQVIEGNVDYEDLWLMSLCSHHIIANSAFSWWSAWLGEQSSDLPRIVIAPQQWFGPLYNHLSTRDIVPDSWVRL